MRNVCTKDNRLTWYAAALVVMGMVACLALGDSIDDAEAKKRGVTVEVVQLERARARIAELEAQVAALQKQLTASTQPKSATQTVAVGSSATTLPNGTVIEYAGHPRTQAWLDTEYKQLGDKIALVDGKYYDVGHEIAMDSVDDNPLDKPAQNVGDFRWANAGGKVLSVINPDEALIVISRGGYQAGPAVPSIPGSGMYVNGVRVVIHVSGFSTKTLSDGSPFALPQLPAAPPAKTPRKPGLVFVGTFKYTSAGALTTVPSYVVYTPLSQDQFAEAVRSGTKLVTYKLVTTDTHTQSGGGLFPVTDNVTVNKKVVATPVQ